MTDFIYLKEISKHETPTIKQCMDYVDARKWTQVKLTERTTNRYAHRFYLIFMARTAKRGRKARFVHIPKSVDTSTNIVVHNRRIVAFINSVAEIQGTSPANMCKIITGNKPKITARQ